MSVESHVPVAYQGTGAPIAPRAAEGFTIMRYLVLLSMLALHACSAAKADKPAQPPAAAVTIAKPVVAASTEWQEYTGHIEAVATVELRARVSGYLTRVGFRDGELVEKGQVLYTLDARPYEAELARAEGEAARANANVTFAKLEAARAEKLIAEHAIADRERDSTTSALQQAEAAVRVAQAAVSSARLNVEYARITAPISGRIGSTNVTAGNLIPAGGTQPLAVIVAVDPLYVYVDVDEAHALALVAKTTKTEPLKAWIGVADEEGWPHEGRIDWIDNRASAGTGTVSVRAVIPNKDGRLRPGLFARLRLPAQQVERAVLVSDRAVGTDQDRKFVYVVSNDTVEYRAVKLGPKQDGLRIIHDGVKPDDLVVVSGLQRVRPCVQVAAKEVDMGSAK